MAVWRYGEFIFFCLSTMAVFFLLFFFIRLMSVEKFWFWSAAIYYAGN